MKIKIEKLGIMPTNSPDDAGYDLHASERVTIYHQCDPVFMDLHIAIHIEDKSLVGLIYPRSSTGIKGLAFANSTPVIDSSYTGNIKLALVNNSTLPITIESGDRIAQIVFTKIEHPELERVVTLDETVRGSNSFGSSGR